RLTIGSSGAGDSGNGGTEETCGATGDGAIGCELIGSCCGAAGRAAAIGGRSGRQYLLTTAALAQSARRIVPHQSHLLIPDLSRIRLGRSTNMRRTIDRSLR